MDTNGNKYGLTYPQKNIWLVDKFYGNTAINVIAGIIEVKENFEIDTCKKVMNLMVKQNDGLRLVISEENGEPVQRVSEYKEFDIDVFDMTGKTEKDIKELDDKLTSKPFDVLNNNLYYFAIVKESDNKGYVLVKLHHLISDAWTFGRSATIFANLYDTINMRKFTEEENPSYIEYVKSENEYLTSEKFAKDKLFWDTYLDGLTETVGLKENTNLRDINAKRFSLKLDEKLNSKIKEYCKENRISPYTVFMNALAIYIYRITEKSDFVIGTPILNRANFREKQMLGMFVSTMPVRYKINEKETFLDMCKKSGIEFMTLFRHQKYPYSLNLEETRKKTGIKENLYKVMLSYQNARAEFSVQGKYSTDWVFSKQVEDDFAIHIMDMDSDEIMHLHFDYRTNMFDEIEVEYIASRIFSIIEDGIDNNKTVEDIQIMTEAEKNKILYDFNDTESYYPKDKTIIDLFEEQAEKTPDNIALVFENKQITYRELNEKANQFAHYLRKNKNIKENENIAVYMNRSEELIFSLIAINKCGCAYIPLDPNYPNERIQYILDDSKAAIVLTNTDNDFTLKNNILNISEINLSEQSKSNIEITKGGDDLVYIIYTSGSTGNPKGVMISNKNLINFIFGMNKSINLEKSEVMVSITTVSFDIFGLEIWLTLSNGLKLVLANEKEQIDGELLNNLCNKNKVNVIQTTPTKLKMLIGDNNTQYIKNMKKILLGGESLPNEFISKLKDITNSQIINVYGPTETTIWSTVKDITNIDYIVAGKPINNTKVLILDNKNRLLPIGTNGQLVIVGDSVSKGYYNNEKLTIEKFIKNEYYDKKIYLTGDLATSDFNGDIKILGRLDFQVKINGQRIELEEIEQKIMTYNNINSAVVVVKNESNLVCFYVLEDKSKAMDENDLKRYLYSKLPVYMVPSRFEKIDSMPLTPNGKIDRKKILAINLEQKTEIIVTPKNTIQKTILESWKKVLKNENIGINSNFFESGGDSFSAIEIKIDLMSKGIRMEYGDIFKYPTVEELSQNINEDNNELEFDISGYDKNYSNILDLNKNNKEVYHKKRIKNVMVTGVTGFLGSHIVSELLDKEDVIVYCIIRRKNESSPNQRLKEILKFFFGNKYDNLIGKRIIAIEGNITDENLGMNSIDHKLISDVEFIVHSAACVKHYGDKQHFIDVNINGTKNVAKYSYENKKKLIHISTLSVSGNAFESANIKQSNINEETIFDETCFYNNQNVDNIYVYTKFKAEEVVLDYINKGLEANIIRFGNLTGRFSDSKFQPNVDDNAFANRIKSIVSIGKLPESCYNMYIEFTPIDLAAEFTVRVMQFFNTQHNMFHAFNHNHIYIEQFISILKKMDININIITDKEFSDYIEKIINDKQKSKVLSGIVNDLNENNLLQYSDNIKIKSDITVNYMKSIGFEWKKIDEEYVKGYIKYLIDIKFLNL